jgi:uncharacterized protein YeaO (DUF488 family)
LIERRPQAPFFVRSAVSIRIVRLGTARAAGEGLRIGTVRRPPRGVPKANFASGNWYDVWLPELSPSEGLVKLGQRARDEKDWKAFARKYCKEMASPGKARVLDLLAALSRHSNLSVGCYCEDEARCHRTVLQQLLAERGALLAA